MFRPLLCLVAQQKGMIIIMKRFFCFIMACVMLATILTGCGNTDAPSVPNESEKSSGQPAAPIVIRCGIVVSKESIYAEALEVFDQTLQEATNGQVCLQVYYDGTMGNERDMIEGVSMGTIEMYASSSTVFANFVDDFKVLDLPYAVDINNLEEAYAIFDGEIGHKMLDSLSSIGIKGLAVTHQGFRCMLNNTREVVNPEDAKNLVIRTMENDVHLKFYSAIGAKPVAMASTEAFTALAQGTINGMDNVLDALYTQGAFESAKYLTLSGHVLSGYVYAINENVFNSLTAEQQAAIETASKAASVYLRDAAMKRMDEVVDLAETEYGVTVTRVDTAAWKEVASSVVEEYKDSIDPEYWDAFYQ